MAEWVLELAGEDHAFSVAELAAALEAERVDSTPPEVIGRHAVLSSCEPLPAFARLAMAHRAFEVVSQGRSLEDLLADIGPVCNAVDGTYRISLGIAGGAGGDPRDTIGQLVKAIGPNASPREPDTVIKVIVAPGRTLAGVHRADTARRSVLSRDVMRRPFFSPVSIRSEYARTLVNLSRVPGGGRLADPFCGGGGILMEAASAGAVATGIDIDPGMLEGAAENLETFGLEAELIGGDVSELSSLAPLDAVATDPPYGRSTALRDEGLAAIYSRLFSSSADALAPGGHLAVALPAEWAVHLGEEHLERVSTHPMKVHRSLTRWFTVFKKN